MVPPIYANPLFDKETWLQEGMTKHAPLTRIELDFELFTTEDGSIISNKIFLSNDT